MPACACAAPQAYSAPEGACGIFGEKEMIRVHDYPCLYPEQIDAMKKAGITVEAVPEGYRITLPTSSERCAALGGSAVSMKPPTIEGELANEAEAAPTEALAEVAKPRMLLEEAPRAVAVDESSYRRGIIIGETQPAEVAVLCTFVKPACPCTPPPETQPVPEETPPAETPPETPPPPPPPPPTTPEAKVTPQFRIAVSSWGDYHAVLLDTGEEIALKEATPELPRTAITTEPAYRFYQAVSAYNKKPNAENLAKLRGIVNENLLGEVKDVPHYGLMMLTPPSKDREDEGASATPADFAAVRAQFTKKAIELNTADGTLKVNTPEALQLFRPETAAKEEGLEVVTMSQLMDTAFAGGQPAFMAVTVDGAVGAGGGEGLGCSLIR
jgi:hypothetical protein